MEVSSYNEAPYQGVSQAPPQVRLKTQAEAVENALSVIPLGTIKRPPFTWMGKLVGHPGATNGEFMPINRGGLLPEGFLTITRESGVTVPRLYNFTTLAALSVTISADAQTYLNNSITNPQDDLRAMDVVDFTFIANRRLNVGNVTTRNAARSPEGMLWVRASAYGRKYTVTVTKSGGAPVVVTLTTPDGSATTNAPFVDTDVIAAALLSGTYTAANGAAISGNLNSLTGSGFTVSRIGAVIYLQCATDFTMDVEDGQGGAAFVAVKDKVQRFSDLPAKVPVDGFVVRITQQSADTRDDFFVRFSQSAGKGTGVWEECLAPNALLGLDPKTMPVGLFNDGAWKLQVLAWKQRTTGDETLVPDPDFIGQPVEDLTYWRGRLAIVSGEGVTLSDAGDPFRVYPRSLSAVLDSDPIARVNPSPGVSTFRYGIPFESRLVAFGDKVQASVTADGVLTPGKADIDTATTFEFSQHLRPQAVNTKLYFVAANGTQSSIIYEMAIDRFTNTTQADPLTAAVPTYIPAAIDRVASCASNYMAIYAQSGTPYLYAHLFRYSEDQRIQNAWQRWTLPSGWTVAGAFFKNTQLYLLASNGTEAHVLMADLSPGILDDGAGATMLTHWDFRVKSDALSAPTYDAITQRTTFTLPYAVASGIRASVRAPGTTDLPEGFPATIYSTTPTTVTLQGDYRTAKLWFGYAYTKKVVPSTWYALDANGKPRYDGRLGLRRLRVDVAKTGYLRIEVTNRGRGVRTSAFEGLRTDDPDSLLDQAPSFTGSIPVPLMGENVQTSVAFINDSHFPSEILGYEWRGEFNPKGMRT